MKNFVKKLFSLLLVGVVAISMFSFVAPTNVEAAEETSFRGVVYFTLINPGKTKKEASVGYSVEFYDVLDDGTKNFIESWSICLYADYRHGKNIAKEDCFIPVGAKIVVLKNAENCHKFKLDVNSESSRGYIYVDYILWFNEEYRTSIKSSDCWKQV